MNPLIVLAVVLVLGSALALIVILKVKWGHLSSRWDEDSHYQLRAAVFSKAERSFLGVLGAVVPPDTNVMGKIRLADVFGTKRGLAPTRRQAAFNRISRKHVDFLLVRASDLAPLAGIELDDTSHESEERKERDQFVDDLFRRSGLPLMHVTAQASYNTTELRAKVANLLARRPR